MTLVLAKREDGDGRRAGLAALVRDVAMLGWLPDAERIVVQVAPGQGADIANETAHALAVYIHAHSPASRVEVVPIASGSSATVRIAAITPPHELVVPARWLEPHAVVTVVAVAASPTARLLGVLEAQAGVLGALGNAQAPRDLVWEAHRLGASDLCVACGSAGRAGVAWWVASPSDVAVDQAIATAAGLDTTELPALAALARHEVLPSPPEVRGALPPLSRYVGAAWRSRMHAAAADVRAFGASAIHDIRMLRRNLGKIPGFVRRRLARGGAGRAAA